MAQSHLQNAQAAVNASQQEIAAQLSTASGLDTKVLGVLGFAASVATVMLLIPGALAHWRWILFTGADLMVVISLLGFAASDDLSASPRPTEFYKQYGGIGPTAFAEQLLVDLGAVIEANKELISDRRNTLNASAITLPLVAALVFGIARLFQWFGWT